MLRVRGSRVVPSSGLSGAEVGARPLEGDRAECEGLTGCDRDEPPSSGFLSSEDCFCFLVRPLRVRGVRMPSVLSDLSNNKT